MPASAVSSPTAVDPDAQRRVGRDRAGDHAIALTPRDRPRLAGDHRLVHVRRPVDDLAVGRNPAARAGPGRRRPLPAPTIGTVSTAPSRTRSASSGSSSASACSAPRAWPTARISSQWPSSMITISAASSHQNSRSSRPEHRRRAGHERDGDRQRDQRHHPRLARAQLRHGPRQERAPAVEEERSSRTPGRPPPGRRSRPGARASRGSSARTR